MFSLFSKPFYKFLRIVFYLIVILILILNGYVVYKKGLNNTLAFIKLGTILSKEVNNDKKNLNNNKEEILTVFNEKLVEEVQDLTNKIQEEFIQKFNPENDYFKTKVKNCNDLINEEQDNPENIQELLEDKFDNLNIEKLQKERRAYLYVSEQYDNSHHDNSAYDYTVLVIKKEINDFNKTLSNRLENRIAKENKNFKQKSK